MKVTLFVLVALGCFVAVPALPAQTKKDEVEIVPLEGEQPIVDTGFIGFGVPFSNPFSGFYDSFESLMLRMRQQMDGILRHFPGINRSNATSEDVPDFQISGAFPTFPRIGDIDLGKGNTTSVTKIIDGHKVVINETEYKKEDDFGGSFFKVRIIDVQPNSNETTTKKDIETTTVAKDRESLEDSSENEISKNLEAKNYENLEIFELDGVEPIITNRLDNTEGEWDYVNRNEPVGQYFPNGNSYYQPIDLSRDTYVNQILADSGAPTNPDAEVFHDVRQPYRQPRSSQHPR